MQPMKNPAEARGSSNSDLLAGSIGSEFTLELPPIQADPAAERAFAYQLAAVVFGKPLVPVEHKRRRVTWRPAR